MTLIKRKQIQSGDRSFFELIEHFIGNLTTTQAGVFNFNAVASGTGATFGILPGEAGSPGIIRQQTGSTATGGHMMRTPTSLLMTAGLWTFSARFRFPTLIDAVQTYVSQLGFGTASSAITAHSDACFIRYSNTSTFLQFVNINNSVATIQVSNVPIVAGQWIEIDIIIDRAGASNLYINGVFAFQCTTNVPTTAGRNVNVFTQIVKSVGTNSSFLEIDFLRLRYEA